MMFTGDKLPMHSPIDGSMFISHASSAIQLPTGSHERPETRADSPAAKTSKKSSNSGKLECRGKLPPE